MSLMSGIQTDQSAQEESKDTLGGGGGYLVDTGIHLAAIEVAYLDKSSRGSISFNVHFKTPEGKTIQMTEYITNQKGENFYVREGAKYLLPGFNKATAICRLTLGAELHQLESHIETRAITLYSSAEGKRVPQNKEVLVPLLGHKLQLGILREYVDVNEKTGTTPAGKDIWSPSGYSKEVNTVDKVFHADSGLTEIEVRGGLTEATFKSEWETKYGEETIDSTKDKIGLNPKPKNAVPGTLAAQGKQAPNQFGAPNAQAGVAPLKPMFGQPQ